MDSSILKSKFLGAFLGTAVGDALGAPFEGRYRVRVEDIAATVESLSLLTYTDDTHMMIGVAESLFGCRGFDGRNMALTFASNWEQEPHRGYGPGPPRIFRMIRDGVPWDEAAARLYGGGSFGNGAAMRIAPIGVYYRQDAETLREIACQSSHITHAHPLGKEGAALQAYAIALATHLEPSSELNKAEFISELREFVHEDSYKHKLDRIEKLLPGSAKDVAVELGNGIEAFNSVPAAICSFLSHPGSFADAVFLAISLGGDTDTIGAMAGAISGAYLGAEAIPSRWRDKLENGTHISRLAEDLFNLQN